MLLFIIVFIILSSFSSFAFHTSAIVIVAFFISSFSYCLPLLSYCHLHWPEVISSFFIVFINIASSSSFITSFINIYSLASSLSSSALSALGFNFNSHFITGHHWIALQFSLSLNLSLVTHYHTHIVHWSLIWSLHSTHFHWFHYHCHHSSLLHFIY